MTVILAAWGPQDARAGLARAAGSAPEAYTELLAKYATPTGVRYAAWHKNPEDLARLKEVVEFYSSTLPPADRDSSLAWHINAYNAWILHNILRKYPTGGPLENDSAFFQADRINISGKPTSFDQIEKNVIRSTFQEPRVHFALNCASESCPPLHTVPFDAATLDADLEKLTRRFINENPQGVVPSGSAVKLSKVFDWYAGDFGGKDRVISYINRYRNAPIPAGAPVRFLDYSWKLNSVP